MKSVKEECLSKLILFGEKSLRHALREPRTRRETSSRNGMPRSRAKAWIQAWGKIDIKEARAAPGPERARAATPR